MSSFSKACLSLVLPCALWSCASSTSVVPEPSQAQSLLPNQLTFLARPSEGETIALQLWMPFGSKDEPEGLEGAALASLRRFLGQAQNSLAAQWDALGVAVNAYVTFDATVLELELLPAELEETLQLLSDALSQQNWDVTGWTPILDAMRQETAHLLPQRSGLECLLSQVFPGDAMAHTPLPSAEAIDRLDPEKLTQFAKANWVSEGAAVIATGPFKSLYFKDFLSHWSGSRPAVHSKVSQGFRLKGATAGPYVALDRTPIEWASLRWGFAFGELSPEQAAQLDLLALVLSGDPQARISRMAALNSLKIQNLRSFATAPKGKGLFVIELDCAPEDVDAVFAAVTHTLYSFAEKPVSNQELDRARQILSENKLHALSTPSGQARRMGSFELRWPHLNAEDHYESAIITANSQTLNEAARHLFDLHQTIAHLQIPNNKTDVDLETWAESLTEKLRDLNQSQTAHEGAQELNLAPGVTAQIYPQPIGDIVGITAWIPTGYSSEPLEDGGISELIAERLASDGMTAELGRDHIALHALTTQSQADETLALLAHRLTEASWTPQALETARFKIAQRRERKGILEDGRRALERQIYRLPRRNDRLDEFTPAEARAWYDAHIAHAPIALTIVGQLSAQRVTLALQSLSQTQHQKTASPETVRPEIEPQPHLRAIDGQTSHLFWGYPVDLKTEDDIASLEVLAWLIAHNPETLQALQTAAQGQPFKIEPFFDFSPHGYLALHLEGPADHMDEMRRTLEIWISKLRSLPTSNADLKTARRQVASQRIISWNDPSKRAQFYAEHRSHHRSFGRKDGVELWHNAIKRVMPRELNQFAEEVCRSSNRVEIWIAPSSEPRATSEPALISSIWKQERP